MISSNRKRKLRRSHLIEASSRLRPNARLWLCGPDRPVPGGARGRAHGGVRRRHCTIPPLRSAQGAIAREGAPAVGLVPAGAIRLPDTGRPPLVVGGRNWKQLVGGKTATTKAVAGWTGCRRECGDPGTRGERAVEVA